MLEADDGPEEPSLTALGDLQNALSRRRNVGRAETHVEVAMRKFCLKCSTLTEVEKVAFDTACPKCGAIYAKLEAAAGGKTERAAAPPNPPRKADQPRWWSNWKSS